MTPAPTIQRIELRSGLLPKGTVPGRLPVGILIGRGIAAEVLEAIDRERILELGGTYGLPGAGDPAQYDSLKIVLPDRTVEITVHNVAISLFTGDDERLRRIFRALNVLKNSIDGSPPEPRGPAAENAAAIREELGSRTFETIDEVNAAAGEIMARRNRTPIAEFSGLSPGQMHRVLDFPFESPELAAFATEFTVPREAPVPALFAFLAGAVGSGGLRATAKGNLPRDVSREAHRLFAATCPHDSASFSSLFKMTNEQDFLELHYVRLVAGQAGLLRKHGGRFHLTAKGRAAADDATGCRAYRALFEAAARKLNWAYFDGYPAYGIIQRGFLYSLLLLGRHGDRFRAREFYGDLFLRAFPAVLEEAPASRYGTPENHVSDCHGLRTFSRFALLFGLAEEGEAERAGRISAPEVRKTPVLDEFVRFTG